MTDAHFVCSFFCHASYADQSAPSPQHMLQLMVTHRMYETTFVPS